MTICIAATCDHGQTMVIASDKEISISFASTQFADGKFRMLYQPNWYAGFAGTVGHAAEVITTAMARTPASLNTPDVWRTVEDCYREVRLRKAEGAHLTPSGRSFSDFLANGQSWTDYDRVVTRISAYDLGVTLLVAGFAADGPCLATIRNPGVTTHETIHSFACAGSGATPAKMAMYARRFAYTMPVSEAAYYVYEAKKAAENSVGVGNETAMYLLKKGELPVRIGQSTLDELETVWNALKPASMTKDQQKSINELPEFKVLRPS